MFEMLKAVLLIPAAVVMVPKLGLITSKTIKRTTAGQKVKMKVGKGKKEVRRRNMVGS